MIKSGKINEGAIYMVVCVWVCAIWKLMKWQTKGINGLRDVNLRMEVRGENAIIFLEFYTFFDTFYICYMVQWIACLVDPFFVYHVP